MNRSGMMTHRDEVTRVSIYTSIGSSSLCVIQRQHSSFHQFWPTSAIHGTLQRFEAINLPFGLAVAPGELDRVLYGIDIPAQNAGEAHNRGKLGVDGIVDLLVQRIWILAA